MRQKQTKLPFVLVLAGMFTWVSCEITPDLPFPMDETLDNTGAFLRIVETTTTDYDYVSLHRALEAGEDPDEVMFSFIGEVDDVEDGETIDDVDFFVTYRRGGSVLMPEEGPIKTYDRAQMPVHDRSGLHREEFVITAQEVADAFDDFELEDIQIGDQVHVRWQLNLADGRTFSAGDAAGDVTIPGFFHSPYEARPNVVPIIPEDEFVGEYEFTQVEGASNFSQGSHPHAGEAGDYLFEGSESFTADVSVDDNNPRAGRVFEAVAHREVHEAMLDEGEEPSPRSWDFSVSLANDRSMNSVTLNARMSTGLRCAVGVNFGPESQQLSQFELDDDSSFTLVVRENASSDCEYGSQDIVFEAEKVE